jgi:hypothetical protein
MVFISKYTHNSMLHTIVNSDPSISKDATRNQENKKQDEI